MYGQGWEAFRLLVLRSGSEVWGYVNQCPHHGVRLDATPEEFLLREHSRVWCATHYAMFRFEDGFCEDGPCAGDSLTRVPLVVRESQVRIAD